MVKRIRRWWEIRQAAKFIMANAEFLYPITKPGGYYSPHKLKDIVGENPNYNPPTRTYEWVRGSDDPDAPYSLARRSLNST
jgi:hypothetical protein